MLRQEGPKVGISPELRKRFVQGRLAHAQVTLERQGVDAGLGLADEVDGQEPGGQRQLGVLHQGAGGQRSLKAAAAALVELAGTLRHKIVLRAGALRAAKPQRPRERLSASAHCASVPKWLRNSGIDMPCWNWIWWRDIRALHQQESSDYGLSGSLDEPAEAGF